MPESGEIIATATNFMLGSQMGIRINAGCMGAFLLFFVCFVCSVQAGGLKTIERTTGSTWVEAIRAYQQARDSPPRSWIDLDNDNACHHWLQAIAGNVPDFTERHRFISHDVHVDVQESGRIIAMGIHPMLSPNGASDTGTPMRMLVIQHGEQNPDFSLSIMPEPKLENSFKSAGLDLSEFTGAGGKWEPEPYAVGKPGKSSPHAPVREPFGGMIHSADAYSIITFFHQRRTQILSAVAMIAISRLVIGVRKFGKKTNP